MYPKSGCSTLRVLHAYLSTPSDEHTREHFEDAHHGIQRRDDHALRMHWWRYEDYCKVLVYRDPYARVVSLFFQKVFSLFLFLTFLIFNVFSFATRMHCSCWDTYCKVLVYRDPYARVVSLCFQKFFLYFFCVVVFNAFFRVRQYKSLIAFAKQGLRRARRDLRRQALRGTRAPRRLAAHIRRLCQRARHRALPPRRALSAAKGVSAPRPIRPGFFVEPNSSARTNLCHENE